MDILEIENKIKSLSKDQQAAREKFVTARNEFERREDMKGVYLRKEIDRVTAEADALFEEGLKVRADAVKQARIELNAIEDALAAEATKLAEKV